ncbi:putative pigment biosynthesis protein [Zea mays]|uniref:Putative pigment biosynthesis protein n=1 Tax=Zea mays TaxID=4577 RepID=A0A1D6HG94_MAIZE|nr:putative pigment biosynthesis protein [Zea mays]
MSIVVASEVATALASRGAVVALESTIICHGMPYPKNLQMAMEVEAIIRDNGAIPATIAVLDGVPHVDRIWWQRRNNSFGHYVLCSQGWHTSFCYWGHWRCA